MLAFGVVVTASVMVVSNGVNNALRQNAKVTAADWAAYLSQAMPDIRQIVAGEAPSEEALAFLGRTEEVGKVFRYKIFDPDGVLRLDSANLDRPLPNSDLADHNEKAARVVETGQPFLASERGDGVNRPEYYAEAYQPLEMDGERIATIEVYVDQTLRSKQLRRELGFTALLIGGITALAFLFPALAFFWRSRQQRETQDALTHAANHDGLTGLLNRTSFKRQIECRMAEGTDPGFWILFIDLDKFKDVNDTRGHGVGDELLRRVADRLSDTVDERFVVSRLGGDEFAILITGQADKEEARAQADQIIEALDEPFQVSPDQVNIGASVGVAHFPTDAVSSSDLLKAADLALYEAKRRGRGRYCVYQAEMEHRRIERLRVEGLLRRAVDQGAFSIAFQPLFRTRDGSLCGFEALLRIEDDEGRAVPPDEFIPIAEETGLIVPLGRLVLISVCRTAMTWNDDLRVAVNLSPRQFIDGKINETVREALELSELPARRLELEVTESILISDPDTVAVQLDALSDMGVNLALDDFGTGYSSLSYLWRYPFNKLKIDRSFIDNLREDNDRSHQVLKTVVALGEVLSMEITAEGVETIEQAHEVGAMNVDFVQGFLYGRPAVAEALADIMAAEHARRSGGSGRASG